jgi:unsaturated rhamnogalacturonyl hydrolase
MKRAIALLGILYFSLAAQVGLAQTTQPSADENLGQGKVIGLDYYFNHQIKNGEQFHYIWEDKKNSGFSKFGDVFKQYGSTLANLEEAPTRADLDKFSIYIIVNPTPVKTAPDGKPNFIQQADADTIAAWVNDGGVLALFANDNKTCELQHFSILAQKFGVTFDDDLRNEVPPHPTPEQMMAGTFSVLPDHPIFDGVKMIYLKEICTLQVTDPAKVLLTAPKEQGPGTDNIMATAQFGKGLVFVVGDPWVYNEYINVKAPTLSFGNHKAAENLARWLLSAASPPRGG